MSKKDHAIIVNNLKKTFRIPKDKSPSLKGRILGRTSRGYKEITPLDGISFEVNQGDFFGIVGRNGSGKSTLLRTIAGVYVPTSGAVHINGSLIPFIELGVGFNPQLTGRENVYLNAALLGFSRQETDEMYDGIVEFAELQDFMEERLQNYSSGMQVRLAFSIAIRAETDILLLDEVLAVGDTAFQQKCYSYFSELKRNQKTVVLVTHSMDHVQQFCTKAMLLERGKVISIGNPAKVAQKYRELFTVEDATNQEIGSDREDRTGQPISINAKAQRKGGEIKFDIELMPSIDIDDAVLTLFLDREDGEQAYRFSLDENTGKSMSFRSGKRVKLELVLQDIFPNGNLSLRASVKNKDRSKEFMSIGNLVNINIDRRLESRSEWDIHWQPNEKFKVIE